MISSSIIIISSSSSSSSSTTTTTSSSDSYDASIKNIVERSSPTMSVHEHQAQTRAFSKAFDHSLSMSLTGSSFVVYFV